MGNVVANISKGRVIELVRTVESGDIAAAQIVVALFTGVETDANLIDADTMAAVEALATAESIATNYARSGDIGQLDDADVTTTLDDSGDKYDADIAADITWTALGNGTNSVLLRLATFYDLSGTDADGVLFPMTFHDFSVTTDGSDLTAQFAAQGFASAGA